MMLRVMVNSSGDRGDVIDFNVWIDELKNIFDFVKQKNSLKIFLIGHSMGGGHHC